MSAKRSGGLWSSSAHTARFAQAVPVPEAVNFDFAFFRLPLVNQPWHLEVDVNYIGKGVGVGMRSLHSHNVYTVCMVGMDVPRNEIEDLGTDISSKHTTSTSDFNINCRFPVFI